jgi:hypothetical protein
MFKNIYHWELQPHFDVRTWLPWRWKINVSREAKNIKSTIVNLIQMIDSASPILKYTLTNPLSISSYIKEHLTYTVYVKCQPEIDLLENKARINVLCLFWL